MVSQTPKGGYYFGREGGVLNAIVGSLYLSSGAVLLSLAFSLPLSLAMNIHLRARKNMVNRIRSVLDILWGIPSIVYGAFGFTLMIYLGIKASLLAGIITVGIFIMPIMVKGMDEVMKNVPVSLLESAFSLGSTRMEVADEAPLSRCGMLFMPLPFRNRCHAWVGSRTSVLYVIR
ncbi:MAG: hypothetical protein RG741_09610 [Bacteroidales bacterium]|nr:hypothetical protein [Bacteroidales bacterium]